MIICLAIDECQYLSPAVLNNLKLIMNHGYAQGNARMIDNLMTDALIIGEQIVNEHLLWK